MTCQRYSRAFLHNLVAKGIPHAAILVSYHNVAYTQRLTRQIRTAIEEQRFTLFVQAFVARQFPDGDVPGWVVDALLEAGITI